MKKRSCWVPLMVGALATAAAVADARAQTKPAAKPACTMDDAMKVRSVMQFLHAANQAEVKLGKLATSKAQHADVKSFAAQMVKEHGDLDKKLTELASKQGVDLNAQMNDPVSLGVVAMHDAVYKDLEGKSGAMFDVAYIAGQPADHVVVLKVIEEGQKSASGEAKQSLDQAHTMLSKHKDEASKLVGMLKLPPGKGIGGGPATPKK